jgi:hypothetical protein
VNLLHYLPVAFQTTVVVLGIVSAVQTLIATIQRMVPPAWRAYIEKRWPRLAWAAKATRTGVNDAANVLNAVLNALRGVPYVGAPAAPTKPPPVVPVAPQ